VMGINGPGSAILFYLPILGSHRENRKSEVHLQISGNRTYQDLARMRGTAATRGWASSRFTSARVAALTCVRVLVRDPFVFSMVHIVTDGLLESVPFGTPIPSFMPNQPDISICVGPIGLNRLCSRAIGYS
jgi:hypothetical protein